MRRYPSTTSSFSFGPGPISTALKALIGINVVMFVAQVAFPIMTIVLGLHPAWIIPAPSPFPPEHVLWVRSEEHTSELQSHSDLVCRLLLEKKKETATVTTLAI